MKCALIFIGLKVAEAAGLCALIYGQIWLGYGIHLFRANGWTGYPPVPFKYVERTAEYWGFGFFLSVLFAVLAYGAFRVIKGIVRANWRWAGKFCIPLLLLLPLTSYAQSPDIQRKAEEVGGRYRNYDLEYKLMREAVIDRQLRNSLADCIERCFDDAEAGTTRIYSQGFRSKWGVGDADCNQDCVAWYLWQLERFYGNERMSK